MAQIDPNLPNTDDSLEEVGLASSPEEFLMQRWSESFLRYGHKLPHAEIMASLDKVLEYREQTRLGRRKYLQYVQAGKRSWAKLARDRAAGNPTPMPLPDAASGSDTSSSKG